MFVIQWLSTPFFKALALSLVHSLWQAAFLFLLAWLILRINKNAPARLKYNIACFAQTGSVVWFIVTLLNINQVQANLAFDSQQIQQSAILFNPVHLPLLSGIYNEEPLNQTVSFTSAEPLLLIIYLLGLCIMTIRTISSYKHTQRLKYKGLRNVNNTLYKSLQLYVEKFQVTRNIRIYLSELVNVPIMLGHLKPVILLPVSIMTHLSAQQIEAIIMHEVAHVRRMDYLLNLFQVVVETIFFFNPFIWLLSNIIRDEREKACDELVIKEISPYAYASALLALEQAKSVNTLAMAAVKKPSSLLDRIKLFTMKPDQMINIKQKALSLCLIVTSICSIAWLTPGHAQDKQHENTIQATEAFQKGADDGNADGQQSTASKMASASLYDSIPGQGKDENSINRKNKGTTGNTTPTGYFNAAQWQKQVAQIQENARRISKEINNNPQLKRQLQEIRAKSIALQNHYSDSSAWKQSLVQLQNNARKMALSIRDNQSFKNQLEAIQQNAKKIAAQSANKIDWDKNAEAINRQTTDLVNALVNNKEWKNNLKSIEAQAAKISASVENNPEWQKNLESITEQAKKIADHFANNPEFEKQIKALTEQSMELIKTAPKESN